MLHTNRFGIQDLVRAGRVAGVKVNYIFAKWDHLNGIAESSGLSVGELMVRNGIENNSAPIQHGTVITVYDPAWIPLNQQNVFTPMSLKRRTDLIENIRVARLHGFRATLQIGIGDYFEDIAEVVGISVPTLRMINGMGDSEGLVIGDYLIVCSEVVTSKRTKTTFKNMSLGRVENLKESISFVRGRGQSYECTVQDGDTLLGFSMASGYSSYELARMNNLSLLDSLEVGSTIVLCKAATAASTIAPAPNDFEKCMTGNMYEKDVIQIRNSVNRSREMGCKYSRVVQIGDDIEGLASAALVPVDVLRKMNGMKNDHVINDGDLILLYAPEIAAPVEVPVSTVYLNLTPEATRAMRDNIIEDRSDGVRCWYKVRKGDCVEAIADAAELSVPALKSLNPTYNFDNVFVGSFLIVYCPYAPVPAAIVDPALAAQVFETGHDVLGKVVDALAAAQVCGKTNSVIGGGSYTFPVTDTYADLCILEKSLKAHIKDLKVTLKEVKKARWDASEGGLHTSEFKIVSWS